MTHIPSFEIAYGGYVFLVPGAMMTPALLAYSLEHDENYLEELLALALEGAPGFAVTYKPGDATRRVEPHVTL